VRRAGMQPLFFRWNDDTSLLKDVDGYFLPGGFSYEDRGRSGMVAARDPLLGFLQEEAAKGKPIIGNCNGAQILVESGLIPLGEGLQMSLARNTVEGAGVGFLSEWVCITPTCARDRCATSDWEGVMALPIAHGEGRFVSKDPDLVAELARNNQIAFSYCDAEGMVSDAFPVTPNGSTAGIAGVCNPAGNVVALMPHPERTSAGDPYFASLKRWIQSGRKMEVDLPTGTTVPFPVGRREPGAVEIFIDTLIVNNEERTVEQAARRLLPHVQLKQLKYFSPGSKDPGHILATVSLFNQNKEVAYIRRGNDFFVWDAEVKEQKPLEKSPLRGGIALLRREEPDSLGASLGKGSETGICYVCRGVSKEELMQRDVLEVFANPHAASLSQLV